MNQENPSAPILSEADSEPWYRTISPTQWKTLLAAQLGWMLDAMDFVLYLMAINTLQEEFHFNKATSGMLAMVSLLTSAAGGMLFGVVADKVGRTRALMATILIFSFCTLGTATSQNLFQLIIWRAVLGLGMGGEWSSGAVLVSETWPARHRAKAISIMQSGWALGYILAAVLAGIVLSYFSWRWLFVAGALPALLIFWVRRHVPEPEIWSSQTGEAVAGNPLWTIFQPGLLQRTISATLLTTSVMFAYWGLFTWLPAFLGAPVEEGGAGLNIVKSMGWIIPMQLGAFAGYLSFGFIADRIGRRPAFIIFLGMAALLVPIYGHMARHPAVLMVLGPLLGFFGHGYFSLFGVLLAELFPTRVRATGQGFTYNAGRAMSALAPLTIGALADWQGIGPALGLTAAFFLAGIFLILIVPRGEDEPAA